MNSPWWADRSVIVLSVIAVVGLAVLATIAFLGRRPVDRTPREVAGIIERFVSGTGTDHEWDDFICLRIRDPELEAISRRCGGLPEEFPPDNPRHYTGPLGLEVLRGYIHSLRALPGVNQPPESLEGRS